MIFVRRRLIFRSLFGLVVNVIHHVNVNPGLSSIYPITDTGISNLTHSEQVTRLLAGGATIIQLREKRESARTFFAEAAIAVPLGQAAGARMIINDRVDIALALKADGVHLGQTDMPVSAARALLGAEAIIGYSTHNLVQVKAALELPVDYLAFGPIFPTGSKENPDPVAGLEALGAVKALVADIPLVAIGGIRRGTLEAVFAAGADCAAIISDIISPGEKIAENFRSLLAIANNQRR